MHRLAILLALLSASAGRGAELTIHVDGVRANQGAVRVALFDSAERFLKRAQRSGRAGRGRPHHPHRERPGRPDYAIAVYHDANDNGKLDQNMMGIPVEATAFSNDALGNMGPPALRGRPRARCRPMRCTRCCASSGPACRSRRRRCNGSGPRPARKRA